MAITFLTSMLTKIRNKLIRIWQRRTRNHSVKSFKENQKMEEAFDHKDRGARLVPVAQIIGSVGRYHDFDSKFRLRHNMVSDRLQRIKRAMTEGKRLPPSNFIKSRMSTTSWMEITVLPRQRNSVSLKSMRQS